MALTAHYYTQFEEGRFYHVYNRTVDRKPMFCNEGNYEYFLQQYDKYLSSVIDTYAYCLLGNHFHLLVRVQDLTTFKKLSNLTGAQAEGDAPIGAEKSTHDLVSHQFRKFFQSYAMAFNKQQGRIGTLFQTPFKRAFVDNDTYFTRLIHYIHANPQLHEIVSDFRNWKWSSYSDMFMDLPSRVNKTAVLDWFGSKKEYERYHLEKHPNLIEDYED